ncbi:MAG: secD [Thermoleophilia bacterium]|jgi:SecD/SecF fusion protein|nr:secD [Thermoleophilia bacterium]
MRESEKKRRPEGGRSHLALLGLVVAVLVAVFAAGYYNAVRLGLDLQGGLEVVLKASPTDGEDLTNEQLEQSVEVIRNRVDALGTTEPEIRTQGSDQIVVSLPGEQDADRAVSVVGSTAQLRFYEWEENVVNGKAFRNAYDALDSARTRAEKANDEAKPGDDTARQLYLFDSEEREIAGPAVDEERLIEQAINALGIRADDDLPKGSETLLDDEELPKDWEVLEVPRGEKLVHGPPEQIQGDRVTLETTGRFDRTKGAYVLIEDNPGLTGDNVRSATAEAGQGAWVTSMIFDNEGGDKFGEVTEQIASDGALRGTPQRFAIILDDEIQSIPQIDYTQYPRGIKGNQAQISGLDDRQEAQDLALVLNTGALPVRFEVVSRTQVSATLGEQSLEQGLLAGAAGLAVVLVYLVLFYRALGIIADLALLAFAFIFYGVIVALPVTMTLPGIAGAILTIGVAADANIIIFERIREEYRAGRSVVQSIHAGYRKGFSTILDASAVTLITAALLFVISIGSVRGFAALLGIGTLLSIFTAVLFTYAMLGLISQFKMFQKPWVIGGSRKRTTTRFHFNWSKHRRKFLTLTTVMIVASVVIMLARPLNLGVDFKSGTKFDVQVEQEVDIEDVRGTLTEVDASYANATIQETKEAVGQEAATGSSFAITMEELRGGETGAAGTDEEQEQARQSSAQGNIEEALDEAYTLKADGFNVQTIGPSFGKQVFQLAIIAVIVSLILEVLYIWWRFEFLYSIPVLLALVHDMAISVAAYALTGLEFKSTTVAALLTILGYSLYDTIIVFDRVRENVHVLRKSSFQRIVTTSINEVLTRSINTSIVVLLPTLMLFLFGGETLQDFAFALLIGVAVGVFSSITVAAPMLSWLKEREPAWQKRLLAEQAADAAKGASPAATTETIEPTDPVAT